jgi:hypothetical protein
LNPDQIGTSEQLALFKRFRKQPTLLAPSLITNSPKKGAIAFSRLVANTRVTESHQVASYSGANMAWRKLLSRIQRTSSRSMEAGLGTLSVATQRLNWSRRPGFEREKDVVYITDEVVGFQARTSFGV